MFELYFGAFDILLYSAAFLISIHVSNVLCDQAEQAQMVPALATVSAAPHPTVEHRSITPSSISLVTKPQPSAKVVASAPTPVIEKTSTEGKPVAIDIALSEDATLLTTPGDNANKPELQLADIKLYKLHKKSVVKVSALPFDVPDSIKRYSLRGEAVIRLEALETVVEAVT